ncbi:hypothetical protein [Kitasatospora kifunensis]|uniref:Uncharacterized protein n=1 Tax=Kitasatospora kifunensis TaxID=58351 RepID=A0A7W7R6S6_KITKI|nr:hypothetical protein [Kitasatospora kifunensis]MBB4926463.1 hypothetical protein [Kitasatospora kifunensis]
MDRQTPVERESITLSRATRSPAAARRAEARAARGEKPAPQHGSVRHTLIVLGQLAPIALLLFGLVGGVPGLGAGVVLLGGAALLLARYVAGADSEDGSYRRPLRLMGSRDPSLADWYWTVRNGLDGKDFPHPLRPRLRQLYAARLTERHNVSFFAEPQRAAALVGPEVWQWLDPESPQAATELSPAVLTMLIDRLETL